MLFNVYVPTSSDMPFKMRFLRALRAAVHKQRASGRAVILTGDFNLARRPQDVPWRDRMVDLARALSEPGAAPYEGLPPALAAKLSRLGPSIRATQASLEVVSVPGRDEGASGQYARKTESWKVLHRPCVDGARAVQLGKPHDTEVSARKRWGLLGCGDEDVTMPDPDDASAPQLTVWRAGRLSVGYLTELITKAVGQPFCEDEQRHLAAHGESHTAPCLREWAESLLREEDMLDSFAEVHPAAQERFTCWEQYTNRRYENDGCRIDYVFVDRTLWPRVHCGAPLAKGSYVGDPYAAEAAASAATAGGRWQPAPFDGSGMADAPLSVFDTQFEPPSTGIRYMPPRYSDHTACTLLLDDVAPAAPPLTLRLDAATLKACPHRQSRAITSFFAPRPAGAAAAPQSDAAGAGAAAGGGGNGADDKKRKPALPPGQKSMRDMFGGGGGGAKKQK